MKISNEAKDKLMKVLGWGFLGTVIAIIFAAFVLNMLPTAKASEKTLQESVEMSQADYDMAANKTTDALVKAQDEMRQYCEMWKALALSKAALMSFARIDSGIDEEGVKARDCASIAANLISTKIPTSF